ncbi:MAG: TauD/TfdA family dioxygenase [Acidimicrobiia bacterium]|nr:TauD/TfdA family dioxygenase [Acidimicrobiia bacterium]
MSRESLRSGSWTPQSLRSSWCRSWTNDELVELDQALATFRRASPALDLTSMTERNFPLPSIGPELVRLRDRLVDGDGLAAYEGFPVERYEVDELRALWWGVSQAVGLPVSQSWRGDVIGDVRDLGTGIAGRAGRGYTSNSELNFHADACDVSGLFFLKTAREGGETRLASSVTTHDVISERAPELLTELYRPLPWSWQGNEKPGDRAWYEMPVFGRVGDQVSCAYVRTNILLAHENAGAPRLSETQREAVQLVADVAAEEGMWLERRFGPGAMLWVHNHTVLHLRTAFVDWDDPARKRHLLRSWVCPPNGRELPVSFGAFFADVSAGAVRGGYHSRADGPVFLTT